MHFYRFWAEKKYKKYLEAPKLKMTDSIQDGRQNLITFG
jgi:hypothetical protein